MNRLKTAGVTAVLTILLSPFIGLLGPLVAGILGGLISTYPRDGLAGGMLGGVLGGLFLLAISTLWPLPGHVRPHELALAGLVFVLWFMLLAGLGGALGGLFSRRR